MSEGKKRHKEKGSLYWRSLALVLLIACLPALLIGIGIYYFGSGSIVDELNQSHQKQFRQSIERIDEDLAILESFSAKLAFQQEFTNSLSKMDFSQQFEETRSLFSSLSLMKADNSLIYDVAFYIDSSDKLISDHWGIRTLQDQQTQAQLQSWFTSNRQIIWTDTMPRWSSTDPSMKGIVTKLYAEGSDRAFGAFLIYLKQPAINQRLEMNSGSAFIMNHTGQILGTDEHDIAMQTALIEHILPLEKTKDTFIHKQNGESYSVSYDRLFRIGEEWIYVSTTPLSQLTKSVTTMSRIIVIVSASGIVLALLLSWFASKRIYDPIRRLVDLFHPIKELDHPRHLNEISLIEKQWRHHLKERERLDQQLQASLPTLREGFLLQFLYGRQLLLSQDEVIEKLFQYDWNIENKRFAVLIAGLYGNDSSNRDLLERLNHEEQLLDYAASNIIGELCMSAAYYSHTINFQDSTIGVLLVYDDTEPAEQTKTDLLDLADNIATSVSSLLKMNTAVVVSKLTANILDLPGIFEETRSTLRLRDPKSRSNVIDVDDIMPEYGHYAEFPFELEQDIIHSMRMGFEDAAITGVERFVQVLLSKSMTQMHVQQGMMKLLGSVFDTMLRSGINPDTVYGGAHLYEDLMEIRNPEEMTRWFSHSVVVPFTRAVLSAIDPAMLQIVEQVCDQMKDELNLDVSLEMYADQFGISPTKLSRAFKQVKGVNFIDYVTSLRIEKCKELLLVSNMKVNEIAALLRYQPSYLIRLFKKSTGMTPGQYREKHTREPERDSQIS